MSIFTSADIPSLKADRLLHVAAQLFPGNIPSDGYIFDKLRIAESGLEQELRVAFGPREVLPTGATPEEFEAAGPGCIEEPGYDYDPEMFSGEAWGFMQLRHKPLLAVHSIRFAYPSVGSVLYTIPPSWIRLEKKYGRLNIVPDSSAAFAFPASSFLLSMLGGGRTIPFMVQVRYRVGFRDLKAERPDIVDVIKRLAILGILDDQYFPTSSSTSVDGLSQSLSMDVAKLRETVDKKISTIRQSLEGIRFVAL